MSRKIGITFSVILTTLFAVGIIKDFSNAAKRITPDEHIADIASFVLCEAPDADILTTFNLGGYFEFNGLSSFFDARPEIFAKDFCGADIVSDYLSLYEGKKELDTFFDKYHFDYVVSDETTQRLNVYMDMDDRFQLIIDGDYKLYKFKERVWKRR